VKKKLLKIGLLGVLLVLAVLFDTFQAAGDETSVEVAIFQSAYEAKSFIDHGSITYISIPASHVVGDFIRREDFRPAYIRQGVEAGFFLLKGNLSDAPLVNLDQDQALITLKCSIVESNGWLAEVDDLVDLYMVGSQHRILIEGARVYQVLDAYLGDQGLAEYYSLIVEKDQAIQFYDYLDKSKVFVMPKSLK